jgi:hypothetical protein
MTSRRYSDRCGCRKGARAPREQSCSVVAGSADVDHDSITMVIADDPARVAVEVREGIPVGGARPGGVVIAILEPSVQPETGQLVLGFESRPSAETVFGRLRGVASQQARVWSHRR